MIAYDPNRDWLRDIRHLGSSWTLVRIARGVLLVGLYASALTALILRFDLESGRSISGTFSLLGVILGIIMVFRTNTAYDRWWEGRKQWGTLVNHSRALALQLDSLLPPEALDDRNAFARLLGDFALALSGHLRGAVDPSILDRLRADSAADRDDPDPLRDGDDRPVIRAEPPSHVPTLVAGAIIARLHDLRRRGVLDGFDLLAARPHSHGLLDVAGACERIRRTPIPFSYSVFIKSFILSYAAILPVGLVPEYGYLAVPLVMLIVFALLGLELMAEEIEEPFGLDCNDLPTDTLARSIAADASGLLRCPSPRSRPAAPEAYSKVF